MKWLDTHLPGSVLGVAGGKRNWHTTAFCAKNRLATEPVRKQGAVVELSRAGGCIKEGKQRVPASYSLARLGPYTLKVVHGLLPACLPALSLLSLPLSPLSLSLSLSVSAARFRKVTSLLSQRSRDRGERALLCSPLCPIHVRLKGLFLSKFFRI